MAFQGKPREGFVSEAETVPAGTAGRPVRQPRSRPGLAFPPRSPLPGRRALGAPRSLPPADGQGSGGDSVRGSPGGQGRGVVLGWLQSVRACAWLALARLQPSSQEPPASTQRVQTDDCHWLRFEARGILLTEKSDTPGGRGEKGAAAQTRGREKGRGKRLYPAFLISIKIRGGAKAFAPKATCFSSLQSGGCKAGKPGACSSRPFRPPGLPPVHSADQLRAERCNATPTLRAWQLLGLKKKISGGLRGCSEAPNPAPASTACVCC